MLPLTIAIATFLLTMLYGKWRIRKYFIANYLRPYNIRHTPRKISLDPHVIRWTNTPYQTKPDSHAKNHAKQIYR